MLYQISLFLALFSALSLAIDPVFVDEPREAADIASLTRTVITSTTKYPRVTLLKVERATRPTTIRQPTSTRTTPSSTTTTSSTAIPTKTAVKGCNIQGTANTALKSNQWDSVKASDVLVCQRKCMYVSQCQSYSYQAPSSTKQDNCVFYHMFIDSGVVASRNSGIFFSNKYPADGSNYCYGSSPL